MTKSKNTKKALLLSVLSVLVCIAMLVGSTFAWFTDSVTSGKNVIKSGNLDISAVYQDVTATPAPGAPSYTIPGFDKGAFSFGAEVDINENNAIIDEKLWEPGATGAKLITVKNNGSLAAKIKLAFDVSDAGLQEALWFDFVKVENGAAVGTFTKRPMSQLKAFSESLELPLLSKENVSFILLYGMNEEAGNEYMNKSFSAGVTILAKQHTFEKDSFNDQYDKNAVYPKNANMIDTSVSGTASAGAPIVLQNSDKSVTATVPADAVTENTKVTLSVYTAKITSNSVTYDISLKDSADNPVILQNGQKVTVNLNIGKALKNVAVKHNGTPMEQRDYTYDVSTGVLTIMTSSFSPFEVTFESDFAASIGGVGYATLQEAVNAAKKGETVTVLKDMVLTESLTVKGDVKINLNKKQVKMDQIGDYNVIQAVDKANLTLFNGRLAAHSAHKGKRSVLYAQDSANVVVENCDLSAVNGYYVVVTNGSLSDNVNMTFRNSTISFDQNYACYFPAGTIKLENCNVTGSMIISGGDVTIDGGIYKADGFKGQPKIWHKEDTISYMEKFINRDGCGHMGDSILIMDRRGAGYGAANVTIQNATFNTELTLKDGTKANAYAIKYIDYNNISGAERGRLTITGNTYNHKLDGGKDPVMTIGIDGTDISLK